MEIYTDIQLSGPSQIMMLGYFSLEASCFRCDETLSTLGVGGIGKVALFILFELIPKAGPAASGKRIQLRLCHICCTYSHNSENILIDSQINLFSHPLLLEQIHNITQ